MAALNAALLSKQLFQVSVDWVDVPEDRVRTLKIDQARAIGEAIRADRQYDPISVTQLPGKDRFLLVDGLHRLEGARMAGIKTLAAQMVPNDRASRRRQEVLSAWARADHDVFDRAAQVAAMVEIVQGRVADVADDAETCNIMLQAVRWDQATADILVISRMQLFRLLKLHRFYSEAQKSILRDRGLADELVPLIRLAALPPEDFAAAFAAIADGTASSIAEALVNAAPGVVAVFDKQVRSIVKKIDRWDQVDRARFIGDLLARYDRNGAPRPGIAGGKTC